MNSTSKLAQDIKATAAAITEGTWTGQTFLRTVTAEETGLDNDVEILYFRTKDADGAIYWVSEDELDELTDADMKQYF